MSQRKIAVSCLAFLVLGAISRAEDLAIAPVHLLANAQRTLQPSAASSPCLLTSSGFSPMTLTLFQSIERAICFDPHAKSAWAKVRDAAAHLRVSRGAYLPTIDASIEDGFVHYATSSPGDSLYSENVKFRDPREQINTTLTIFDFGLRYATDLSAKYALISAYSMHDDALRTVILETAKAYYALLRAESTAASDRQSELYTRELSEIAAGRFRGGVALATEKLQAASVYEDAVFKRINAEGDTAIAKGALAALMGMRADMPFEIVDDLNANSASIAPESFDQLAKEALQHDPKVAVARANLESAEADLHAEEVRNMPTLSIVSSIAFSAQQFTNSNPTTALYQNPSDSTTSNNKIGLRLTVPISSSFIRADRVTSAKANVSSRASDLESAVQASTLEVWNQYQKMHVAQMSFGVADQIVNLASEFLSTARGRYEAGAGTLIDVLNAQSELTSAHLKRNGAQLDLRVARLSLLSSIGSDDFFKAQ